MPRIRDIVVTWEADADEGSASRRAPSKIATFCNGEGRVQTFVFEGPISPIDLEWLYWLAESVEVYEREQVKLGIGDRLHHDKDITEAYQADDDETEH